MLKWEASPCMPTFTLSLTLRSCKRDLRTGLQSCGCLATNGPSSSFPHSSRNKGLSLRALKGNISSKGPFFLNLLLLTSKSPCCIPSFGHRMDL